MLPPRELSQALARFTEGLSLKLGPRSWALLLRLPAEGAPQTFSPTERDDARFLSRHFSTALQNANRFLSAEQEARRDPLTGLLNARTFRDALSEQLKNADAAAPIAVLFLDIDRFKTVNDEHGHLVGSRLLVELGSRLSACVREQDLVARYGGDEFVLLLPGLHEGEAILVAERIRSDVGERPFTLQNVQVSVSVSVGLAIYPQDARQGDTLLECADRALYAAKAAGRNRVCRASDL